MQRKTVIQHRLRIGVMGSFCLHDHHNEAHTVPFYRRYQCIACFGSISGLSANDAFIIAGIRLYIILCPIVMVRAPAF